MSISHTIDSPISTGVSVVIPLYNKKADVPRAIASAFGQTHPPAEVIVVDDGSTDGGAEAVAAMADSHIRLERQRNSGVSIARNRGIELAACELIAFLDADDEWMPDHLETICRLRRSFPQCDLFATSYVFRVGARAKDRRAIFRGLAPEPWEGVLEDYFGIAAISDPPVWSSATAATRTALQSVGGFPVGIPQGEDLLTWARLALRYQIAFSTRSSAVFWQPTFDSAAPTRKPERIDRVGAMLAELLEQADERTRPSLRRYLGLWHKMRGTMYLRLGDTAAARAELRHAWKFSGFGWRLGAHRAAAALPKQLARYSAGGIRWSRRVYRVIASRQPLFASLTPQGNLIQIQRASRPKIIVISGNNGGGNRGDELMCEATCAYFLNHVPNVQVVTDSCAPAWKSSLPGVRVIPQVAYDPSATLGQRIVKPFAKGLRLLLLPSLQQYQEAWPLLRHGTEFLSELPDASALVFAGCGVLTDRYAGMLLAWRAMILAAKAKDVPVFVSGIGGGPLNNGWLRQLLGRSFSQVEAISCRDPFHTKNVLLELGVAPSRLIMVPDDAAFYNPVSAQEARTSIEQNARIESGSRYVALSLMLGGGIDEDRLRLIGRAAKAALPGMPKLYVSLSPKDMSAMKIAAGEDPDAQVVPLASAGMTKAIFGSAWMVLSARYHGCVFAFSQSVPAVGIVADDYWRLKIDGVCRMFCAEGSWVDLRQKSIGELQALITSVAQARDKQAVRLQTAIQELEPLAYYVQRQVVERINGATPQKSAAHDELVVLSK